MDNRTLTFHSKYAPSPVEAVVDANATLQQLKDKAQGKWNHIFTQVFVKKKQWVALTEDRPWKEDEELLFLEAGENAPALETERTVYYYLKVLRVKYITRYFMILLKSMSQRLLVPPFASKNFPRAPSVLENLKYEAFLQILTNALKIIKGIVTKITRLESSSTKEMKEMREMVEDLQFALDYKTEKIEETIHTSVSTRIDKLASKFLGVVSLTPSTYTQRYKELTINLNAAPTWGKAKIPLIGDKNESIFANPPDYNAGEKQYVQPWFTKLLEEQRQVKKKKEVIVPPLMPHATNKIELRDEHGNDTIGTRRPGWTPTKPHNVFYVIIIGELKGRRGKGKEEFTSEEKGQLESFMEDLAKFQQQRKEFTGFLSDGKIIQFFTLQIDTSKVLQESPVYNLDGEGGEYLMGLLSMNPSALGMPPVLQFRSKEIIIEKVLGLGASSVVFAGKLETNEVVVKHFRPAHAARLTTEKNALTILNGSIAAVPKLIGETDDHHALLMTPVAQAFCIAEADYKGQEKPVATAQHFMALVAVLQQAHKLGLIHRDITLSNMFLHKGVFLLNDWGCATKLGAGTAFAGSLRFAPTHLLDKMAHSNALDVQYTPTPEDDLEMVVKCLFCRLDPVFHTLSVKEDIDSVRNLITFWNRELAPRRWQELLKAARDKPKFGDQYANFAALIRKLLA